MKVCHLLFVLLATLRIWHVYTLLVTSRKLYLMLYGYLAVI